MPIRTGYVRGCSNLQFPGIAGIWSPEKFGFLYGVQPLEHHNPSCQHGYQIGRCMHILGGYSVLGGGGGLEG